MSTRTAERIKEYEQRSTREDLRHEREDKGASTRVRVKGYEGYEDMSTRTSVPVQEYE